MSVDDYKVEETFLFKLESAEEIQFQRFLLSLGDGKSINGGQGNDPRDHSVVQRKRAGYSRHEIIEHI